MNSATNVTTRRNRDNASSVVEYSANGRRYSRTFEGSYLIAERFATSLRKDRIRITSTGRLRYRSYDRKGAELWLSQP